MACQYDGGVVLGADSRTSTGTYVANRASDKITQVTDNVWMCRSGSVRRLLLFLCVSSDLIMSRRLARHGSRRLTLLSFSAFIKTQAADTQNVCAYVKNLVEEHNMQRRGDEDPGMADVKLVATITTQLAYRNKDKLSAGMIIGGWDRKLGAQVYGIPLGGSMQRVPFTVGGSGSAYIYGWCDNTWRENMSRSDAEAWVARAISLAIARDASSGGVVRLVTIHDKGSSRQMLEPKHQSLCESELPVIPRG
jgi:20S proteasome subunit beta 1